MVAFGAFGNVGIPLGGAVWARLGPGLCTNHRLNVISGESRTPLSSKTPAHRVKRQQTIGAEHENEEHNHFASRLTLKARCRLGRGVTPVGKASCAPQGNQPWDN